MQVIDNYNFNVYIVKFYSSLSNEFREAFIRIIISTILLVSDYLRLHQVYLREKVH